MKNLITLVAAIILSVGGHAQCWMNFTSNVNGNTADFTPTAGPGFLGEQYYWDFGDGNSSWQNTPSHTYNLPGTYIVCATVYDSLGTCQTAVTFCDSVVIAGTGGGGCAVNFSVSESNGLITGTNNSTGGTSYEWYVMDSNWNILSNPQTTNLSYQTSTNGVYTVCLYGYDNGNFCDSTCNTITVTGNSGGGCSASFWSADSSGWTYFGSTSTGSNLTYTWDFGDGNTGTGQYPVHQYNAPGLYVACLTIDDGNGCTDTYCDTVQATTGSGTSCSASFTYVHDSTNTSTVYFGSNSTGTNLTYTWNWGDGSPAGSGQFATHTYANTGSYYACLTIDDGNGCSDTYCAWVIITNSNANCNATFWQVDSANTVYFMNNSTGTSLNYYWDFGDGNTSTQANPTHTYSTPGSYTVCLSVWNGTCADTTCSVVTVQGPTSGCSANYVWFLDTAFAQGGNNTTVYIFNLAQGSNLTYFWDFGDGNSSNQPFPTHQYVQNGTYYVCLTIDDGNGCTDTYCDSITYVNRSGGGFTINIQPLTSNDVLEVEDLEIEVSDLYPNPADQMVNIEVNNVNSEALQIVITDLLGKIVVNQNEGAFSGTKTITINVAQLEAGVYNVLFNARSSQKTARFIKN